MTDTSVSNTSTPGGDFAPRSTPGTPPAAPALFVLTIAAPAVASGELRDAPDQISNILHRVSSQLQIGVLRGNCVVGNLVGTFNYIPVARGPTP
jgi:hypothetical protein